MDNNTLMHVVKDHFGEEPEVMEVVMYALSTLTINDAIVRGVMTNATEVRGIPPESYSLMKKFDNGMTTNKFWHDNFAPIKMQLAMDDIKLNTTVKYITFIESKPTDDSKVQFAKSVRSIMLSRCDVLTTIAFLWKGVDFAQEFDTNYRSAIQLTPEYEQYFQKVGI